MIIEFYQCFEAIIGNPINQQQLLQIQLTLKKSGLDLHSLAHHTIAEALSSFKVVFDYVLKLFFNDSSNHTSIYNSITTYINKQQTKFLQLLCINTYSIQLSILLSHKSAFSSILIVKIINFYHKIILTIPLIFHSYSRYK